MDTRDIYKLVREFEEEDDNTICLYDSVDLELNESFVIETGVVDFTEDGIVLHLDEDAIEFLDFHGIQLNEDNVDEDYMGFEKVKAAAKKGGAKDPGAVAASIGRKKYGKEKFQKAAATGKKLGESIINESSVDAVRNAVTYRITRAHPDILGKYGPEKVMAAIDDVSEYAGSIDLDEIGSSDISIWTQQVIRDLESGMYDELEDYPADGDGLTEIAAIRRLALGEEEIDEGWKSWALGGAALLAAILGGNELSYRHALKNDPQLSKLTQYLEIAQKRGDEAKVKELKDRIKSTYSHLAVTGGPVMGDDGKPVDPVYEAEYQGRKVPLGKPMKGDVKKSKVYVKKPNGNVVKVEFGDPNMRIKKSNPKRRKSFRARHHCENPGPRWKARYWSCRAW